MLLKQLWTFLSLSLFLLSLFSHPFSFFHSLFSLFPLGLTAAHASDHPGCKKRRVVWTEKRLIFIRSLSFSIVTLCSLFSLCLSLFCSTHARSFKRNDLKTRGHVNRVESRLMRISYTPFDCELSSARVDYPCHFAEIDGRVNFYYRGKPLPFSLDV